MAVIFKEIGTQDAAEGGSPIAEADFGARTLKMGTKLPIKTLAAAYTFVEEDSGTFFKITAALTLTLPAAANFGGCHLWVFNATDTDLVIATTANELRTFNDVDADAITFSTTSEKVGAAVHLVCDGVCWMAMLMTEETQTTTVTT